MMCETIVIGAGVIGLAVGRGLAMAGKEVIVLERENAFGQITSSRNSSVIHAGIYYPKDSLKAQLCVQGKKQLYDYVQSHGVDHRMCGKIIVATSNSERQVLESIQLKARANGVHDLIPLTAEEVRDLEPHVHSVGGLLSPSTGIVDSYGFMMALLGDLEDHGGAVAYKTTVVGGRQVDDKTMELQVQEGTMDGGGETTTIRARQVVNAAGLVGLDVTKRLVLSSAAGEASVSSLSKYGQHYAKGNYYLLSGEAAPPFNRLVYPVPVAGGLGVHATLDLGGQIRFGPDVEWVASYENYEVDVVRSSIFYEEIRKYYPSLKDNSLVADYSGIRPKLLPEGTSASDFVLWDGRKHGVPSLMSCLGIESPGLTSSISIAERVVEWSSKEY
jgi:L-2-hydroxyglutarate oxidase LhgO